MKSSPVLIVRFEILHEVLFNQLYVRISIYTAKNAGCCKLTTSRHAGVNNVVRPTMNKLSTMLFQVVTVEQCCNNMLTILFIVGRTTLFTPVDINLQQVVDFLNIYAYIKMSLIIQKNNQNSTG